MDMAAIICMKCSKNIFYEFREIIILLMESYKTCVLAFDHKSKYLNKGFNYN